MHKTSAWPLALIYAGLIVYASLFPFAGWRDQGVVPWFFLTAPLPRYWTAFDVVANLLGYMPLGFFLVLSALRTGRSRYALRLAVVAASVLSLLLESLQVYLPNRVPSNLDLMLNMAGGALGALSAWSLEKWGVLQRWSRFRAQWFVAEARGGLVLLALWPLALLFPTSIPLGLGQVLERLQAKMAGVLAGTPFLEWWPVRQTELQALWPVAEWLCVVLGLLIPCLLGFCIIRHVGQRAWFLLWVCFCGLGVGTQRRLECGAGARLGLAECAGQGCLDERCGAGIDAPVVAAAGQRCAGAAGFGCASEPVESDLGEPLF